MPAAVLAAGLLGPLADDVGRSTPGGGAVRLGGVAAAAVRPTPSAASPRIAVSPLGPAAARIRVGERATPVPVEALTGYRWPLPRGRITQPFGPSAGNSFLVGGVEMHDGIDLATFCGDRVLAAHDGVVIAAGRAYQAVVGWQGDLAPYLRWLDAHSGWASLPITVVIDDGDTYRSVYAHFSRIVVAVGQRVHAGQLIGYEGRTGHATGCHVHFGLFSPLEPSTWTLRPDLVRRYALPPAETARIDPLRVLPARSAPGPTHEDRPAVSLREAAAV